MTEIKFGITVSPGPEKESQGQNFTSEVIDYLAKLGDPYESVWMPDHLTGFGMIPDTYDILEAKTTVSYLSALYQNLDFGTIVTCNSFRNPAMLAKMGATLDAFTEGRFILGMGAGWYADEYRQYGYDYPSAAKRIRQLDEALQIIKLMWTQDDVTFNGRYYEVKNAYCNPKPDPIPPIMVGCSGEKLSMKLVVKYGDWWNMAFPSVDQYERKLNVLKNHCNKMGRDPDTLLMTQLQAIIIAETDEKAKKKAKDSKFIGFSPIIGSPETVKNKLKKHIDIGVDYFMISFSPFPDTEGTIMFSEEVIPELKEYHNQNI